jgi:hypothetical protein
LFVEHADLHPARSDVQMTAAIAFVNQLEKVGANYFKVHPSLEKRLTTIRIANPNYLVHEYMHKHWQPVYHADVARHFADVKLGFVGAAEIDRSYEALYLNAEQLGVINSVNDAALRETLKDFSLNTGFRKDVYMRGKRSMSIQLRDDYLKQYGLVLLRHLDEIDLTKAFSLSVGNLNVNQDLYQTVISALENGAQSFVQLLAHKDIAKMGINSLTQIAVLLTAAGHADLYRLKEGKIESAHRMNVVIADQTRYNDEYQYFISPLSGASLSASFVERLIVKVLFAHPALIATDKLTELNMKVAALLAEAGRRLMNEGKIIDDAELTQKELAVQVKAFIEKKAAIWKRLLIL